MATDCERRPDDADAPCLYGVVTVGERGQLVIPAEARKQLDINAGDRLVVLEHPFHRTAGLVLLKAQEIESIVQRTLAGLTLLREEIPEGADA